MIKKHAIIKRLGEVMATSAENAGAAILSGYQSIKGREEEITAQLRNEFNRHLMNAVAQELGKHSFEGIQVKVATFTKQQESKIGADLAGVLEIQIGSERISKAYLAQAKIGQAYTTKQNQTYVRCTSRDLLKQAKAMLSLSSDSFIFLYSKNGITCVPAFQVILSGGNSIDTRDFAYRSFGSFYEEFVKCFIGDQKISPSHLNADGLEDYADKLKVSAVMLVTISQPSKTAD